MCVSVCDQRRMFPRLSVPFSMDPGPRIVPDHENGYPAEAEQKSKGNTMCYRMY